jgi:hypothetical protein
LSGHCLRCLYAMVGYFFSPPLARENKFPWTFFSRFLLFQLFSQLFSLLNLQQKSKRKIQGTHCQVNFHFYFVLKFESRDACFIQSIQDFEQELQQEEEEAYFYPIFQRDNLWKVIYLISLCFEWDC